MSVLRRKAPSFTVAFLALGLVAAALPAQATPESILARYSQVIDPLGKIPSITGVLSNLTMEIPAAGMSATITSHQRRPNQMVLVISIPAIGEMRQGYDGTTAWATDAMQGPRVLTGAEAAILIDGADFAAMSRPTSLFTTMELAGEVEVDGEKAACVKLTWKSGRVTTECFSTVSGLLVESRQTQQSAQGSIEIVGRYADYKAVDGVLIPHRVTQNAMGMMQVMTTTSVVFGALDSAMFVLPPEIRALRAP